MSKGEKDLNVILRTLEPEIQDGCFCFYSASSNDSKSIQELILKLSIQPRMTYFEKEGLTFILNQDDASNLDRNIDSNKYSFKKDQSTYKIITIKVHSSLEAVGLTAFLSKALASDEIPANVVCFMHIITYMLFPFSNCAMNHIV